jgi:hypothetical protein
LYIYSLMLPSIKTITQYHTSELQHGPFHVVGNGIMDTKLNLFTISQLKYSFGICSGITCNTDESARKLG